MQFSIIYGINLNDLMQILDFSVERKTEISLNQYLKNVKLIIAISQNFPLKLSE